MSLPTNILVAVDFSAASDKALDLALEWAEVARARVTVLHTYAIPIVGFPDGSLIPTADVAAQIATDAQKTLEATVSTRNTRGVSVTSLLRTGDPQETILAVADELGADLVVMGTHGRRGLAHALLGSVAEHVVRLSPVPVLTLRDAGDEK